jgi:AraC-like DNA-binding protein
MIVAQRWGFMHYGRFAAQYRQRFGCLPGETLRGVSTNLKGRRAARGV